MCTEPFFCVKPQSNAMHCLTETAQALWDASICLCYPCFEDEATKLVSGKAVLGDPVYHSLKIV